MTPPVPNPVLLLALAAVVAAVVVALLGWDRYRPSRGGSVNAHPTNGMFIDPVTGRPMRVWYDPTTGAREYREERPPGAP